MYFANLQIPFPLSRTNLAIDTAPDFHFLHGMSEPDSGVAFDALRDVLYAVSSKAGQIIAYDTTTFTEKYRVPIGNQMPKFVVPFDTGTLVASANGSYLALEAPTGVRIFNLSSLTADPPRAPDLTLSTRRGIVFDHSGRYVYLSTSTGLVERYELATGRIEAICDLGGILNGIDISSDDSSLLVAQDIAGIAEGALVRVDLTTRASTGLTYLRAGNETGSLDVAPIRTIHSNSIAEHNTKFRLESPEDLTNPAVGAHISRQGRHWLKRRVHVRVCLEQSRT